MAGRPSSFNSEIADHICERIANGESLRAICAKSGMPSQSMVFRWLASDDEQYATFRENYARARKTQADALADEMLDAARRKSKDQVAAMDKRLLIDALKWRAGKLNAPVYGDRQTIDNNVSGSVAHSITVKLVDE